MHGLHVAHDVKRWHEAHQAFGVVRALTLDDERKGAGEKRIALLYLAENVAKVVYNASGAPAPFDHDAGWRVAPCLRAVIRAVGDDAFAIEAEATLFDIGPPATRP